MSEPEKMASFIMKARDGWSDQQMQDYFADGKMRDVSIPDTMPVYMLYYTVWISDDGRVVYGNDLYGYDNKLIKMLRNIDGIFIPVDNNETIGN
jgi:murein L,D-transpeptidase YcbB/YkuD